MNAGLLHHLRLRPRLGLALLAGVLIAAAWPAALAPISRALLGWNSGVWLYLLMILWHMGHASPSHVQREARQLVQGMPVVLLLAIAGALASLAAIVLEQSQVRHGGTVVQGWPYLILAVLTVAGSWLLLPVQFALAYASLYHRGEQPAHGLEFPGDTAQLDYSDFLYFSITLAATSQTSDVTVSSRPMRRLVLLQALLSFAFNTGVLALTINILASLLS